jgi:hypothetical protein
MIKQRSALTILAGVGACAVVWFAPLAGADDPPPCDQRPQDQQQQCQQDQGAGIANQVIDEVTDRVSDQVSEGARNGPVKPFIDPQTGKVNPGPVGQRALINGVDTCLPTGVPAPLGADVRIVPGDMTGHCILAG